MSQTPDIVDRLRSTYAEPVVIGNGIIAPKRKSTCAVTQVYRNPDGPDGADTIEALRSEVTDLQNTIIRLTRELATVLSRDAETQRRHDAKVDALESQLAEVRDAEAAAIADWLRTVNGYGHAADAIARHEHRKD